MRIGKIIVAVAACATILLNAIPTLAKQVYVPDLTRDCSVKVTVQTPSGEKVPGGKVGLFLVGNAVQGKSPNTGDYYFEYAAEFAGVESDLLRNKTSSDLADAAYAKKLAAYAKDKGLVQVASGNINDNGEVTFGSLSAGLYLLIQSEANPSFRPFAPFLVTLPYNDKEGSQYIYDLGANPKTETVRETQRLESVSIEPLVKKVVSGSGAPSGQVFTIVLKGLGSDCPMPNDEDAAKVSLQISAKETKGFGNITYTRAGTYTYNIFEDTSSVAKHFTYDKKVYWYQVKVASDGVKLYIDDLLIREGGSEGKTIYSGKDANSAVITFTNIYEKTIIPKDPPEKTPPRRLPQTGQLWWPVWLLAGLGMLFLAAGVLKRRH